MNVVRLACFLTIFCKGRSHGKKKVGKWSSTAEGEEEQKKKKEKKKGRKGAWERRTRYRWMARLPSVLASLFILFYKILRDQGFGRDLHIRIHCRYFWSVCTGDRR